MDNYTSWASNTNAILPTYIVQVMLEEIKII